MQSPMPGSVLAVGIGPITHFGIATEVGTVISNSLQRHGVAEETLQEFSNGRRVVLIGHLGNLPSSEVLVRARSAIGKPWNLFRHNCEHFVRWAHGLKPSSPQLNLTLLIVAGVAAWWFLTRK